MAIKYSITSWAGWGETAPVTAAMHVVVKRRDAAANALYAAIYNMLHSASLLDRPVATRLVEQFNRCEVSPPPLGGYRAETFALRPDDITSPKVEFWAERI